jgi:CheY-like chemotaxis protein
MLAVTHTPTACAMINNRPAVLVDDDEPDVRLVISRMLVEAGFAVVAASPGSEAYPQMTDTIDVAIVDIRLPGLSGLEVAQRAWSAWPSLPILFVSAFPEPAVTDPAPEGLVQRFLAKPFSPDQLVTAVFRLLGA